MNNIRDAMDAAINAGYAAGHAGLPPDLPAEFVVYDVQWRRGYERGATQRLEEHRNAELARLRARVAELEAGWEQMDRQRCATMKAAHVARRIAEQAADALRKCRDAMTREAWQDGASIAEAEAAAADAIANVEAFSTMDWNAKIKALLDQLTDLRSQLAARDEAISVVLAEHQQEPGVPWCRLCGPEGGRFPCSVHAELAPLTAAKERQP